MIHSRPLSGEAMLRRFLYISNQLYLGESYAMGFNVYSFLDAEQLKQVVNSVGWPDEGLE